MTHRSKKKFKTPVIGDCVAVAVPEFDRGRCDPPNIVGIIFDISEDSKFKIGTRPGILSTRLERNAFGLTSFTGLKSKDIPNTEASLKEIVQHMSVGNG